MPDLSPGQQAVAHVFDMCLREAIDQARDEGQLHKIPATDCLDAVLGVLLHRTGRVMGTIMAMTDGCPTLVVVNERIVAGAQEVRDEILAAARKNDV